MLNLMPLGNVLDTFQKYCTNMYRQLVRAARCFLEWLVLWALTSKMRLLLAHIPLKTRQMYGDLIGNVTRNTPWRTHPWPMVHGRHWQLHCRRITAICQHNFPFNTINNSSLKRLTHHAVAAWGVAGPSHWPPHSVMLHRIGHRDLKTMKRLA